MKKAIFGVLFVAIFATLAFALMFLCNGYAYLAVDTKAVGYTISCPNLSQTGVWSPTDTTGYFQLNKYDPYYPAGTEYYLKATKTGYATKYSSTTFIHNGEVDHLGNVMFTRSTPPPMRQ